MRRPATLLIFLITVCFTSQAQFKFGLTPSGKHAQYAQAVKSTKKLVSQKQYRNIKDSLKVLEEIEKYNIRQIDSLRKAEKKGRKLYKKYNKAISQSDTAKAEEIKKKAENKGYIFLSDNENLTPEDIDNLVKLAGWTTPNEFREVLIAHQEFRAVKNDTTKSLDQKIEQVLEPTLKKVLGDKYNLEGLDQNNPLESLYKDKRQLESLSRQPEELQESFNPKNIESRVKNAQKAFVKDGSQLDEAQKKLAKLKRKYSYVPNSNDLSTAVKKSSLHNKKFYERFVYGGNLQIASTDPFVVDLRPTLGFLINKYFAIGVGGSFRQTFGSDSSSLAKDARAFNLNVAHDVWNGFFATSQFERQFKKVNILSDPGYTWNANNAFYLGIGKRVRVSRKIYTTFVMLYDVLHDKSNKQYKRPLSFRVGFEWK